MPHLLWLHIAGTKVTDKAISTLAKCNSIRALDVCDTALTDKCLPTLLQRKALCYLSVEETRITEAGQRRLMESWPLLRNQDSIEKLRQSMRT